MHNHDVKTMEVGAGGKWWAFNMKKHLFLAEHRGKGEPKEIKAGVQGDVKRIRHLNETLAGVAGYQRELEWGEVQSERTGLDLRFYKGEIWCLVYSDKSGKWENEVVIGIQVV